MTVATWLRGRTPPLLDEVDQIGVLIVGDHPVLSEALALRLSQERDFRVVGWASCRRQVAGFAQGGPSVAVVDADFEGGNAFELLADVLAIPSHPAVVMLMSGQDVAEGIAALDRNVLALVLKTAPVSELLQAIRLVARNQMWVSPPLLTELLANRTGPGPQQATKRLSVLTKRELEVLGLLVAGLGHRSIAARLDVSPNTVRTHSQNLQKKLGVHSALAAVVAALEAGLRPGQVAADGPTGEVSGPG